MQEQTPSFPDQFSPGITLSSQSELLNKELTAHSERLANMHRGVFAALADTTNPDYLAQAAHSARELMEKAPLDLPDVPIEQSSGKLKDQVKELHVLWRVIKESEQWKDCPPWEGELNADLGALLIELDGFFDGFSKEHQERSLQAKLMVQRLDPAGPTLPETAMQQRIKWWMKLKGKFTGIAHHNPGASEDSDAFLKDIEELERFLLDLLAPQPVKEFSEIDQLISEGES
jgi:hypothetical protein